MGLHPFRLEAVMRCDPDECMRRVRHAVDAVGGWILDVTPFSNLALTFSLELSEGRLQPFVEGLRERGAALSKPADEGVDPSTGTLSVQLVHDQGDRKMPVPAVPG